MTSETVIPVAIAAVLGAAFVVLGDAFDGAIAGDQTGGVPAPVVAADAAPLAPPASAAGSADGGRAAAVAAAILAEQEEPGGAPGAEDPDAEGAGGGGAGGGGGGGCGLFDVGCHARGVAAAVSNSPLGRVVRTVGRGAFDIARGSARAGWSFLSEAYDTGRDVFDRGADLLGAGIGFLEDRFPFASRVVHAALGIVQDQWSFGLGVVGDVLDLGARHFAREWMGRYALVDWITDRLPFLPDDPERSLFDFPYLEGSDPRDTDAALLGDEGADAADATLPGAPALPEFPPSAGEFRSGSPGLRDQLVAQALWMAARGADAAGWNNAADMLRHFLDASGEPFELSPEEVAAEAPSIRDGVNDLLGAQSDAALATALEQYDGSRVEIPFTSDWESTALNANESRNWYYAIHNIRYAVSGAVVVEPGPNGPVSHVVYQVHMTDRYDWDPSTGQTFDAGPISISAEELAHLQEVGLAQEYVAAGTSETYTRPLP